MIGGRQLRAQEAGQPEIALGHRQGEALPEQRDRGTTLSPPVSYHRVATRGQGAAAQPKYLEIVQRPFALSGSQQGLPAPAFKTWVAGGSGLAQVIVPALGRGELPQPSVAQLARQRRIAVVFQEPTNFGGGKFRRASRQLPITQVRVERIAKERGVIRWLSVLQRAVQGLKTFAPALRRFGRADIAGHA